MKQQMPNKRTKYLLWLTVVLCIGLFSTAVGTAYARYSGEREKGVVFQVREPEKILLGTVQNGIFSKSNTLQWIVEEDVAKLEFAVANGTTSTSHSMRDQIVQLCIVGTLGILTDGEIPELSVTYIPRRGNGEPKTVKATATPIVEGTALYHSFGPGWLYSFYETTTEGKRELTWELDGGKLSYIALTLQTEGVISDHLSLLQPLVSAEATGN